MKRALFFALMASAILFGCKKKDSNEPTEPKADDPQKIDTVYTDVYLTVYASPFAYEYSDFKIVLCNGRGMSVRELAYTERIAPMDTVVVDSAFYSFYKQCKAEHKDYLPPLDSIKIYMTTEKVSVSNIDQTECCLIAVRNSKELDLQRDIKYNTLIVAKSFIPDDKKLNPFVDFEFNYEKFCTDSIDLGTNADTAEIIYNRNINGIFGSAVGYWYIQYKK